MISGVVNERLEAVVSLELRGPKGDVRMFDAIVDTGYDGYLTVAPRTVAELGLPLASTGRARLADGSVIGFGIHHGTVIWDGQALLIELDEADTTPLVGMAMLDGHDLHLEVAAGGRVTIERRA